MEKSTATCGESETPNPDDTGSSLRGEAEEEQFLAGARTPVPSSKGMSRAQLIGGVLGNILEWYDFAAFGYLAEQLAHNFFRGTPFVRMFWVYSTFACAFFARPFGGTIVGKMGDRYGRKFAIQLTTGTMLVSTFLIGCLPTFAEANVLAPLMLLVLRVIQGFSAGGELIGSFLLFLETAEKSRRGFMASIVIVGARLGIVLAAAIVGALQYALSPRSMNQFGWRIPFLLSAVLGVFAMATQWQMADSREFQQTKANKQLLENPLRTALSSYHKEMAVIFLVLAPVAASSWVSGTWLPNYISENGYKRALPMAAALLLCTAGLRLMGGHLADRYHWFNVLRLATLTFPGVAVFVYWFAERYKQQCAGITVAILVSAPSLALFAGSVQPFMNDIVDAVAVRYTVIGIAYNCSMCLFGGTAPLVAESLSRVGTVWVGVYLGALSILSFSVLTFVVGPMLARKRAKADTKSVTKMLLDYSYIRGPQLN